MTMPLIPKFCHNTKCMYVCQSDPNTDVYAHADAFCPNCQEMDSYKAKDIPLMKAEIPDWCIGGLIRLWWKRKHQINRTSRQK